jgi:hypothetical protein
MSLNSSAIPICGLLFDGHKVADITRAGNKFGWRVSRNILQSSQSLPRSQFYPNLREANIECLKWLKANTNIDVFKLKSDLMLNKPQQSPLDIYRDNFKRRSRLPAIILTKHTTQSNPKHRRQSV